MSFSPSDIASQVTDWTNLGIKIPKDLAKAVGIFEAARWAEVGYAPRFDLDSLTPDNAEAKIRELAQSVALSVPQGPNGASGSVLVMAKQQVMDAAARRVLSLARAAVPDAIKQLAPRFSKAAEAYTEAVSKLPDEITSDTLVSAGPDAVEAYGQARTAAGYLDGSAPGWRVPPAWAGGSRRVWRYRCGSCGPRTTYSSSSWTRPPD